MINFAGKLAGKESRLSQSPAFLNLSPAAGRSPHAEHLGFRFGDKGTHTSRTMMLAELSTVLEAVSQPADRQAFTDAIVDMNCLGKSTTATRRLTDQRLSELYALDRSVALFRILSRLWNIDERGRPLLALLTAIARDPLLAATVPAIVSLVPGDELNRDALRDALRSAVGERLNPDTLDKVARNIASSWTQSGHLEGRTFKRRQHVEPTPASVAFALYLAQAIGFRGEALFSSGWLNLLDCQPSRARELAGEAKRLGLIDLRTSGDVVDINLQKLDPASER